MGDTDLTPIAVSGTVAGLYARATGLASGVSIAVTVFHNGVATSMTCTAAYATTANVNCTDTTHTFSVSAGDTLGYKTVTGSTTPTSIGMSLKITGAN